MQGLGALVGGGAWSPRSLMIFEYRSGARSLEPNVFENRSGAWSSELQFLKNELEPGARSFNFFRSHIFFLKKAINGKTRFSMRKRLLIIIFR
jgi:hypothetical protein